MTQSIMASVGEGGKNHPLDVATVQALLYWLPDSLGGSSANEWDAFVTTVSDSTTIAAIRNFQQDQFAIQDGLVEPSDFTMRRLNAVVDKVAMTGYQYASHMNPISLKFDILNTTRTVNPTLEIVDLGAYEGTEPMTFGGGIRAKYENGIIIHHPALGAFEIHGKILAKYDGGFQDPERNAEDFGYPISDQRRWLASPSGLVSHFEYGSICYHLTEDGTELVGPIFHPIE